MDPHSEAVEPPVRINVDGSHNGVYASFMGAAGLLVRRVRGRLFALLSVVIAGVFIPGVLALNVIMEHEHMGNEWMVIIPLWDRQEISYFLPLPLAQHAHLPLGSPCPLP